MSARARGERGFWGPSSGCLGLLLMACASRPSESELRVAPGNAPTKPPSSAAGEPALPHASAEQSASGSGSTAGQRGVTTNGGAPASGSTPPNLARPDRDWTHGIVDVRREAAVATLSDVRVGAHTGYERLVFEFAETVPGYHIEYIDRPVRDCGTGNVIELAGDGWLEVRLYPANLHDATGKPTFAQRHIQPRLPILLEAKRTCSFEAVVTWVVATASPNRYRVVELTAPPRLVIDLASP